MLIPKFTSCIRAAHSKKQGHCTNIKKVLSQIICRERKLVKQFRSEHGNAKIGEITVNMVYGGMRGIKGLLCDTSELDTKRGILFRGLSIPECQEKLPKAKGGCQPLPEAIFWLLLTGLIPTEAQVKALSVEWVERSHLPCYVIEVLKSFPEKVHPMTQLSAAITTLNTDSKFNKAYHGDVPKSEYWEYIFEDSMNLIARLPVIAATIYKRLYRNGDVPEMDCDKDWAHNFATLLGFTDPEFVEFLRMYLTIHCDHEGGNVSSHTTHLVGSSLSDPYLAFASGLNGLAGPLHGLATQEVLVFIEKLRASIGVSYNEDALKNFIWETLNSGHVVPGFGHAVLRITDPRYSCLRDFCIKHFPDDPMFKIVDDLFHTVPPILQQLGKVQNPWPNVDAQSGIVIKHYGIHEYEFYTVLFGVSRALGVLASLIWHRALGIPIERPKSMSTKTLIKMACGEI